MRHHIRLAQLLVMVVLSIPNLAYSEVLERPKFNGYVYDYANVITASDEIMINAYAETVENIGAGQVVAVTVNSLSGMNSADYGLELFNSWGIGHADINDGLLILLAPNERSIQICTGLGIDTQITDEECGALIDEFALQRLRENEFSTGMLLLAKAACLKLVLERSPMFDDAEMLIEIAMGM